MAINEIISLSNQPRTGEKPKDWRVLRQPQRDSDEELRSYHTRDSVVCKSLNDLPKNGSPYDNPGLEPKIANESDKTQALHDLVNRIQEKNLSCHRHGFRGTHVKTQGIVKGKLKVLSDLPEHLSQGLFSNGGRENDIAIRFANDPSFLQDDRTAGPRGCGMKVFDVDDEFLNPAGRESRTHDFTFNNALLREKYFDDAQGLKDVLEQRSDKDLQFAPTQLPNRHFLSYTMYSQSAFRYGDYVMKYALFPTSKLQEDLANDCQITEDADSEQHSAWLKEYFREHDAEFDFRVQLLKDVDEQSVEDCSMEWNEEKYSFETVARVVLPKGQDAFDARRRVFWEDHMMLNPWYGIDAHRSLGSVTRLRKTLYQRSVARRNELNSCQAETISDVSQIP